MPHRALPYLTWWLIITLSTGFPALAQTTEAHAADPENEPRLRHHLRLLEHLGVLELLEAQRDVNERQRQRAVASTHPEELSLLAGDENGGVRFAVASNPHTPVPVLQRLAQDALAHVRAGVSLNLSDAQTVPEAAHPDVEHTGHQLARDEHPLVRLALASNPHLPESVLLTLSGDQDGAVRLKLASNERVCREGLRVLAHDDDRTVRVRALGHRNTPPDVLLVASQADDAALRVAVGGNINAPPGILEVLAGDPEAAVRLAVARHPGTPGSALQTLAEDAELGIVLAVAQHRNAERNTLFRLAADPRWSAVRTAAQASLKPLLRSEIREDLLERWDMPGKELE